jgi:Nuclear pore protein 84 / 107
MIALYTAQVTPAVRRREVYGKFLRSVTNTQVRRICLELANTYFPADVRAILRYCLHHSIKLINTVSEECYRDIACSHSQKRAYCCVE